MLVCEEIGKIVIILGNTACKFQKHISWVLLAGTSKIKTLGFILQIWKTYAAAIEIFCFVFWAEEQELK